MRVFAQFFHTRPRWIKLQTLYSAERVDAVCLFLAERHIPCRVRAAILPTGGMGVPARSLWYLSVQEHDASRVEHYLRTEGDF